MISNDYTILHYTNDYTNHLEFFNQVVNKLLVEAFIIKLKRSFMYGECIWSCVDRNRSPVTPTPSSSGASSPGSDDSGRVRQFLDTEASVDNGSPGY